MQQAQKTTIRINRNDLTDEIVPKYNNYRNNFKVQYRLSAFKEFRKENEVTMKKPSKNAKQYVNFKEFCKNNTLHGLPYVGDDTLTIGERTFWAIATVSSFILAIFFIFSINRFHSSIPVIQNIDPLPSYIKDYPFPAITICFKYIMTESLAKKILSKRDPHEMNILNYTCYKQLCYQNYAANESEDVFSDVVPDVQMNYFKFVVSCDHILKICQFGGEPHSCKKVFKQTFTKYGSCCSFNKISDEILFRYKQPPLSKFTYSSSVLDWTIETGYPDDVYKSIWPWRPKGSGLNSGLVVVLDTGSISTYCENLGLNKLTFFLHKPTDQPELAQPSAISLGYETAVQIIPRVLEADRSLRKSVHPIQRGCYFNDERKLGLYRRYSRINCINECAANYTNSICHCIPVYYPQYKKWKICGLRKWCCTLLTIDRVYAHKMEANKRYNCSCLSECETLEYDKIESYGTLIQMPQKENILKNYTDEYIRENIAVLNVFFKSTTFVKLRKQAMYNISQYLSNVGGILALFMGFSFFTAAELLYYGFFKSAIYVLQIFRPNVAEPKRNKLKPNKFNIQRAKY